MNANERWDAFCDAAAESVEGLAGGDARRVMGRLEAMSEDEFSRLCASYRVAEVRSGAAWLARRLAVYVVAGGVIAWSLPRLAMAWAIVLALVGAALVLGSVCLDSLAFVRLERRCLKGLGMSVVDALLLGPAAARLAREFHDNLDDAGGSLA